MTTVQFFFLFFCTMFFGSIMGAYFGTAEYRIRSGQALITVKCHCPQCLHTLTLSQQIPLISWFLLKGRCHYCGSPIPIRYPLIEGGFLICYGVSFLLLWRHPLLLPAAWTTFVFLLLLIRCRPNLSLGKGLLIFALYHLLYGSVLALILTAVQGS